MKPTIMLAVLALAACATPKEAPYETAKKAYQACVESAANPHTECRDQKATADKLSREAKREIVWENIRRQAFRPAPALSATIR